MSSDDQIARNPIVLSISSVSVLCCVFVIYRGCKTPKPMKTATRLIILVSLCDFTICLTNFFSIIESDSPDCSLIGSIKHFASWNELCFCSLISMLSYLTLKNFGKFCISKAFKIAIMCCLILTLFIALMPVFHIAGFQYTRVDGICKTTFIEEISKTQELIALLFTRGTAYFLTISTTLFAYVNIFIMSRRIPGELRNAYSIHSRRLLMYPAGQIVIFTPIFIYNIIAVWTGYDYYPILIVTAFWSLGGFVNFLVYGGMLLQQEKGAGQESEGLSSSDYLSIKASEDRSESAQSKNADLELPNTLQIRNLRESQL